MTAHNRPLSPHLQVYRLPLTGLISITHRVTGVMLSIGLIFFVYLLFAVAAGEGTYNNMQTFMSFWLCKLIYWGFIFALYFHVCHGIRHLLWDMGQTFDRLTLYRFAVAELSAAVLLFLLTFIIL